VIASGDPRRDHWGGIERDRVAELIVEAGKARLRGTGYRVTASAVLTAAHVIAGATAVQVRFNADLPDEWESVGTVLFEDRDADVAVLGIVPRWPDEQVAPARFGRLGHRPASVPCTIVGFPLFKTRDDLQAPAQTGLPARYRDSAQVDGVIPALSNWREGTLEIKVTPAGVSAPRSPWEGMSGAAVWCDRWIVGLISRHHHRDGPYRLAAVRVDRWYQQLSVARLAELRKLISLPESSGQLRDVIPVSAADAIIANYAMQADSLAPDVLRDRDGELADVAAFCAGDEPYQWWQAGPWSGKTALAAWLVAREPPAGASVVSFFVRRRSGQQDSRAFQEALIQQLAVIAGQPPELAAPAVRDGQYRRLLEMAASAAHELGNRLLLLVDGLDEDEGALPAGPPSIASLLPRRPPAGMRILVTSRRQPGVPGDVPDDHPLRTCTVRELSPSPHAEHIAAEAKLELASLLQDGDQLKTDIIGYIAAAGDGLTLRELLELTEARQPRTAGLLGSAFGRSLDAVPAEDHSQRTEQLYWFAHDTLRELAEQQLSYQLADFSDRIHRWADRYQEQGWPGNTPRYLLRPYTQMLARTRSLVRLAACSVDRTRHDRMLAHTLSDTASLAEVADAGRLLPVREPPELISLTLLAIERDRLTRSTRLLPPGLPAVWVRAGDPYRGQQLADSIGDDGQRAAALTELVTAFASAGQPDRARQAARDAEDAAYRIKMPWNGQAAALARLASAAAVAGLLDAAEQLIADRGTSVGDAQWAFALVAAGRTQDAVRFTGDLCEWADGPTRPGSGRGQPRTAGDERSDPASLEQAEQDSAEQESAEQESAEQESAEQESAAAQAERAARFARRLRRRVVTVGQPDPEQLPDPGTEMLGGLKRTVFAYGPVIGKAYMPPIGKDGRPIEPPAGLLPRRKMEDPTGTLGRLAGALATAGQPAAARRLADHIAKPARSPARCQVAIGLSTASLFDQAEEVARGIADGGLRAAALAQLAASLGGSGKSESAAHLAADAEQAARAVTDSRLRAAALANAAAGLAAIGQPARAARAALDSERAARAVADGKLQAEALGAAAFGLSVTGQYERAERAAGSITDPAQRASGLAGLAAALAAAGLLEQARHAAEAAQQAARAAGGPAGPDGGLLADLAAVLTAAGQLAQAEEIARRITGPDRHAGVLAAIAGARRAYPQDSPPSAEFRQRMAQDQLKAAYAWVKSSTVTVQAVPARPAEATDKAVPRSQPGDVTARIVTPRPGRATDLNVPARPADATDQAVPARPGGAADKALPPSQPADVTARIVTPRPADATDLTVPARIVPPPPRSLIAAAIARAVPTRPSDMRRRPRSLGEITRRNAGPEFRPVDGGPGNYPAGTGLTREAVAAGRSMGGPGPWHPSDKFLGGPHASPSERLTIAWTIVAADLAAKGKLKRARRMALAAGSAIRGLRPDIYMSWVLGKLFGALVAVGELEAAERAARSVGEPSWWQITALAELVGALVSAGELAEAERIAQDAGRLAVIGEASERELVALLSFAEKCRRAGSPDLVQRASRLCAIVLTSDSWGHALPLLCQLDAPGLDRAVDTLIARDQEIGAPP